MKLILSVDKYINLFVCVSIIIILCDVFWWYKLPEVFVGGDKLMILTYNISVGYLVSYIFYLVVVRLKEFRDESHINSIIIPILDEIHKSHALINDCLKGANTPNDFDENNKKNLKSCLAKIKFDDNIPRVGGTFLYTPAVWADFLDGQKKLTQKNIQRTFAFIPHLDPELIRLLTAIDNSHFFISLIFVSKFNAKLRQGNMENIADSYFEYNQVLNNLGQYINKLKSP